jgi:hypothetical protein
MSLASIKVSLQSMDAMMGFGLPSMLGIFAPQIACTLAPAAPHSSLTRFMGEEKTRIWWLS